MKLRILRATALLAMLCGFAAPVPPPPPEGRWISNWGNHICTLIRQTSGPEALALSRAPGAWGMQLRWVNKDWTARDRLRKAQLFLEPGHVPVEDFDGVPLAGHKGVGSGDISYHMLDRLAAARSIRLQDGNKLVGEIALPGADQAVRALRECNDDALRGYGLDPDRMASLQELPKMRDSWGALFSSLDYPSDAIRMGISGISVVRLEIDEKGAVERCTIVKSSNDSDLDKSTCRGFSRAHYEPAIGPDGNPTGASLISRILWRADDQVELDDG
jgi:TonB family protein